MNYVIDENNNLVSADIQEMAFNAAHPVGEIYIQFPGKEDPQTLYGRGTWDNISNEYAGLFFRAEGGNANPFEGGSQEDKIRNIKGATPKTDRLGNNAPGWTVKGAFYATNCTSYGSYRGANYASGAAPINFQFDANRGSSSDNPMAGHADGPEIRPVNTTIRIWQRTA